MTTTADDAQAVGASPWLTPDEAAAYAKVSRSTIYKAAAAHELVGSKLSRKAKSPWRFRVSDVDEWLGRQRPSVRGRKRR